MNTRLIELINYVSKGNKAQFAREMQWKPQYLNNLINNSKIGLSPIITLLQKFPELNARWLLLGEGKMFLNNEDKYIEISSSANNHLLPPCKVEYIDFYSAHNTEFALSKNKCNAVEKSIVKENLKTPIERERDEIHVQICNMYLELTKEYPNVKSYRLMTAIASQFNRTVPGIRRILIANGLYDKK